ncbi:MAG: PAS domain S-box protein [Fibrobacteria bacterium]|nr:PAS domain S-box protein [Fibrobacteria bacterium]
MSNFEENERYLKYLNKIPTFVTVTDLNGIIKFCNEAPLKPLGLTPKDVIGKYKWDIPWWSYDPELQKSIKDMILRAAKGESFNVENEPKVGPRTIPIKYTCEPLKDEEGNITEVILTGTPIIEQRNALEEVKKTKLQLSDTESKYKDLIQNAPIGIVLTSISGIILEANQSVLNIFGYEYENEIIGKSVKEFFLQEKNRTLFLEKIIQNKGQSFELQMIRRNGDPFWVRCSTKKRTSETGDDNYISIFEDITERKKASELLEKERLYLSEAQEIGSIGTWDLDIKSNILIWTPENYKIFGVEPGTPLNYESFLACLHPDDIDHVDEKWKAAVAGEPYDVEHRIIAQGKVKWVRERARLSFDDNGEVTGAIGVTQDITERKKTEEEILNARDKALESDKLKNAFLSSMSHEIRTPLNHISMGMDIIKESMGGLTDEQSEYFDILKSSESSLLNILNDMVDISMINEGQLHIKKTDVNVHALLEGLHKTYTPTIEAEKPELSFVLENARESTTISTDPERLKQVLSALINNAIKFTETGEIKFGVKHKNDTTLEFYVQDSGIGIPIEKYEQIFDKFFQLDHRTEREYSGLGLGLAISKSIITLLGGEIGVESELNRGTTFSFTLPYQTDSRLDKSQTESKALTNTDTNTLILIAEDDFISFGMLKKALVKNNYEVMHAPNGEVAVELVQTNNFGLIFMDINMPIMNGKEAIQLIRSKNITTPIIAITGLAMKGDEENFLQAGCNDYIAKPTKPEIVLKMADRYFKKEA